MNRSEGKVRRIRDGRLDGSIKREKAFDLQVRDDDDDEIDGKG